MSASGLMGAPMAANLLAAGWAVTAWNRSPAALDAFEALGGSRVARVEALRDQPVIVFMLPDLSYIEDAAAGLLASWAASPPAPGTAVVVMSSVSPAGVQDFGARVARGERRQRRRRRCARQRRHQGRGGRHPGHHGRAPATTTSGGSCRSSARWAAPCGGWDRWARGRSPRRATS